MLKKDEKNVKIMLVFHHSAGCPGWLVSCVEVLMSVYGE
jgi:hypothetical protein